MREIKFRAWDKQKKRMRFALMGMANDVSDSDELINVDYMFEWDCIYPVMQYTGLKDKNGKEIYEGDIVNCTSGCPHQVVWMQECPSTNLGGMPGFYLSGLSQGYVWMDKEELIGNIHEHPELLK